MSGQSKKDIAKRKANLKRRLEEMEKKAKYNVLDKNLQAEVAKLRQELTEL
jgi:F0F1-type ATP synthase epsilon subunit